MKIMIRRTDLFAAQQSIFAKIQIFPKMASLLQKQGQRRSHTNILTPNITNTNHHK
jgi:hypothetical protein